MGTERDISQIIGDLIRTFDGREIISGWKIINTLSINENNYNKYFSYFCENVIDRVTDSSSKTISWEMQSYKLKKGILRNFNIDQILNK